MVAFTGTPASSTQYAKQIDPSVGGVDVGQGFVQFVPFDYTHALGAGTGEINLVRLPPGKIRIYPSLSFLRISDLAASATADLGHRAYVTSAGVEVAEDDDEWVNDATVHTGPIAGPWASEFATGFTGTTTALETTYDAASGLIIFVSIDSGNIEDGDTITGWVAFTKVP